MIRGHHVLLAFIAGVALTVAVNYFKVYALPVQTP